MRKSWMKNKKGKGVGRAGFLWSEGRDKEAARTEGFRQREKNMRGTQRENQHIEKEGMGS